MTKSKSPNETTQVRAKGMNIDPLNNTNQEDDKPIEVKTYSDITIQTKKILSKDLAKNQMNFVPH